MQIKITVAALILAAVPGLALAQDCSGGHGKQQASMSCADGMVYDAESNTCVPLTTG